MNRLVKLQGKGKAPVVMDFPEEDGPAARGPVPAAKVIHMPTPIESDAQAEALSVPDKARAIVVSDQDTFSDATEFLKDVKRIAGRIADTFDPLISAAHSHHRALIAEKKKFTDPLDAAERAIKPKIAAYLEAEDRKRREAERMRAEVDDKARQAAVKAVAQTNKHEAAGRFDKAYDAAEKGAAQVDAIMAAAPVVPEAPRAEGVSLTESWKFEIIDPAAVPREFCKPDEVKIGALVRGSKGAFKIPGVRAWSEKSVSARV